MEHFFLKLAIFIICFNINTQPFLEMDFLNDLGQEDIEEFKSIQNDKTLTKADRDSRMKKWARVQGKKVQASFFALLLICLFLEAILGLSSKGNNGRPSPHSSICS